MICRKLNWIEKLKQVIWYLEKKYGGKWLSSWISNKRELHQSRKQQATINPHSHDKKIMTLSDNDFQASV